MSEDEGRTGDEHVGSLGEEAVRLVGALSGWLGHVGDDLGGAVDDLAGHVRGAASQAAHDLDEHLATGAPECRYCPVCRTVHVLREVTPEVRSHLADAATSLAQAALGFAAAVAAETSRARAASGADDAASTRRPSDGVQHIDLDDDPDEEPDDYRDGDGGGAPDPADES